MDWTPTSHFSKPAVVRSTKWGKSVKQCEDTSPLPISQQLQSLPSFPSPMSLSDDHWWSGSSTSLACFTVVTAQAEGIRFMPSRWRKRAPKMGEGFLTRRWFLQSEANGQDRSKTGCALEASSGENLVKTGSSWMKSYTCGRVLSLERPPAGTCKPGGAIWPQMVQKGIQWVDGDSDAGALVCWRKGFSVL